jgi:hypothetical protein
MKFTNCGAKWNQGRPMTAPVSLHFRQVNLLMETLVQGILVQGDRSTGAIVTQFQLQYGVDQDDLIRYEEVPGATRVFP